MTQNEQEKYGIELKQKHLLKEWKHLIATGAKIWEWFLPKNIKEPNPKRSKRSKRSRFVSNCVTHKIPSLLVTVSPSQMHKMHKCKSNAFI